jgi:hypothetical protein
MNFKSFSITVGTLALFALVSCTDDRIISTPDNTNNPPINGNLPLKINETVAKGSLLNTDLGNTSDWMEIYNSSASAFTMQAGAWFVTDNPNDQEKFELPQRTIAAGDFLVIFCDDSNRVSPQIHTNFGLSSAGESLFLYYKNNGELQLADSMSFDPQTFDNMSNARKPDGSTNWVYPSDPTPGNSNQ